MAKCYKIKNDFGPVITAPKIERIIDVDVILMTCGGGMGGASWKEFVIPERHYDSNTIMTLKDVFDVEEIRTKEINTSFVVTIEHKKLVQVSYDMRANSYFGYIKVENYIIDRDDAIVIVDDNSKIEDRFKPNSVGWSRKEEQKIHFV